jgi:UDP-N-acetylglucosamine 3-dehydrogenase
MTAASNTKIRAALFGMGRMGKNHLRVLRESPRFELVAVVDPVAPQPDAEARKGVRFVRSIDELPDDAYDCAVVATPTVHHYAVALELIRRGKHLLVEKPLASGFKECAELVHEASTRNLKLAVGHVERFNPAVRKLREVIASGLIGTPIHFSVTRVGGYPETLTQGNNVLIDLAVHDFDVLRSLLGPLRIGASVCHSTVQEGICDTAEILMSSSSGASATVHVNWITPTKIRTIRVTGTRAVLFVDYMLQTCTMNGGNLLHGQPEQSAAFERLIEMYKNTDRIEFGITKEEPLRVQLEQFHQLLLNGDPGNLCLGGDASAALLLAQRAFADWNAQKPVAAAPPSSTMPREDAEWI